MQRDFCFHWHLIFKCVILKTTVVWTVVVGYFITLIYILFSLKIRIYRVLFLFRLNVSNIKTSIIDRGAQYANILYSASEPWKYYNIFGRLRVSNISQHNSAIILTAFVKDYSATACVIPLSDCIQSIPLHRNITATF